MTAVLCQANRFEMAGGLSALRTDVPAAVLLASALPGAMDMPETSNQHTPKNKARPAFRPARQFLN